MQKYRFRTKLENPSFESSIPLDEELSFYIRPMIGETVVVGNEDMGGTVDYIIKDIIHYCDESWEDPSLVLAVKEWARR